MLIGKTAFTAERLSGSFNCGGLNMSKGIILRLPAAAALLLVACGDTGEPQEAPSAARAPNVDTGPTVATIDGNPAHNALAAMAEADREAMFQKLLAGGGEDCSSVSRTFYQGRTPEGQAFWNVECRGATSWTVSVAADAEGSTRVLSCSVMEAVAKVPCWKPLES